MKIINNSHGINSNMLNTANCWLYKMPMNSHNITKTELNLIAGVEIAVETLIVSYSHHLLFVTSKRKEILVKL